MKIGFDGPVAEGVVTDFPTFVMQCARRLPMLREMLDDSAAEIPEEFQPRPWFRDYIAETRQEIAQAEAWSDADAEVAAVARYERDSQIFKRLLEQQAATQRNYTVLLQQAEQWTPPTAEHEELKRLMVSRLADELRFAGMSDPMPPVRLSGAAWRAQFLATMRHALGYAEKREREEIEKARSCTEWVRALRNSLTQPAGAS